MVRLLRIWSKHYAPGGLMSLWRGNEKYEGNTMAVGAESPSCDSLGWSAPRAEPQVRRHNNLSRPVRADQTHRAKRNRFHPMGARGKMARIQYLNCRIEDKTGHVCDALTGLGDLINRFPGPPLALLATTQVKRTKPLTSPERADRIHRVIGLRIPSHAFLCRPIRACEKEERTVSLGLQPRLSQDGLSAL
jgi:hypothetical protein